MGGTDVKGLKEQEMQLLTKVCRENNLPMKLVIQLKKLAEEFSYKNSSPSERRKEYTDLIYYYSKPQVNQDAT